MTHNKKTLPQEGKHFPHSNAEIYYCCKSPKASQEDIDTVEKFGTKEIVNCVNCRGQFILSKNKFGLHVGILQHD